MNNEKILKNSREDFILKYRAAVKVKCSKEQLSEYLNMKPKSLLRRRLELKQNYGLDLPLLHSSKESFDSIADKYFIVLQEMADKILKIESVNDVDTKTKFDIQKNKKYVITSAQNATPIHLSFFKSLQKYCEYNNATLLVIPNRYKNPTSIWSMNDKIDDWWDIKIKQYLVEEEIKVSKHLRIMGNIKIQPTATSPLSGFDTISDLDSAVFGHPRVEWRTVPSVAGKLPKILVTTGSITVQNYTDSKVGHKGALHHKFGALIVEVDDDELFHIRHIEANPIDGSFHDLDKKYTSKDILFNQNIVALIAGDSHAEHIDENVKKALYLNKDSVAELLKPSYMIFHDVVDFSCRNHHNIRDEMGRFRKHYFQVDNNIEDSLQKVASFLDEVSKPYSTNIIVRSNHDEHIDRYLKEADPVSDPENARFYYYMKYNQYKAIQNQEPFDALAFWLKNPDQQIGMRNDRTKFLKRTESFELLGIELSMHGDVGSNGSRGSVNGFSKLGQKVIVGHSHQPNIVGNAYQVGTSSGLNAPFNKGPNGWLNTSAIIYPSGAVTLFNIIDGKWKL